MNIGFVTCQETILKQYFPTITEPDFTSPEPLFTPDDYIAVTELRAHGHDTSAIIWGTPPDKLRKMDLIIVRSPWDYIQNETNKIQFFAWLDAIEHAGLPVANPPSLMRWLLDKHYLQDLASLGVLIIPTQYIEKNGRLDLSTVYAERGPVVLKQCISAGGTGLFFIDSKQAAKDHQTEFN